MICKHKNLDYYYTDKTTKCPDCGQNFKVHSQDEGWRTVAWVEETQND